MTLCTASDHCMHDPQQQALLENVRTRVDLAMGWLMAFGVSPAAPQLLVWQRVQLWLTYVQQLCCACYTWFGYA